MERSDRQSNCASSALPRSRSDPQRGVLYLTGTFTGVGVYAGLNELPNGTSTLDPTGSFGGVNGSGIAIDSVRDRLYVADSFHGV